MSRARARDGSAGEELAVEYEAVPSASILDLCAPRTTSFASGRTVELEEGAPERLVVRSPTGLVELSVRFGPEGPTLSFAAAAIDLSTQGPLRVDCAKLAVVARDGIDVQTGGSVKTEVRGDHEAVVTGAARIEADSVAVRARLGDVAVKANDDVRLNGERIFLND